MGRSGIVSTLPTLCGLVLASAGLVCTPAAAQTAAPPAATAPSVETPALKTHADDANASERSETSAKTPTDAAAREREAFFAAHLAALHAGLTLTKAQDAFWGPVETAIRGFEKSRRSRPTRQSIAALLDQSPSDLLRLRGEQRKQSGEAMLALAEATAPLLESLDESQKNRLPILLEPMQPGRMLRAAFDIRFGKVVDEPDDDAADHEGPRSQGDQASPRDGMATGDDSGQGRRYRARNGHVDVGRGDDDGLRDRRGETARERDSRRRDRFDAEDEDRT